MKWAWLVLAAVIGVAACSAPRTASVMPAVQRDDGFDGSTDWGGAHAPCPIVPGLVSPVQRPVVVATAFGQLMKAANGAFYAYPDVAIAVHPGEPVLAALSGSAYYEPSLKGFGKAIVVKGASGADIVYGGFARAVSLKARRPVRVEAGRRIAVTGSSNLVFEYAPAGLRGAPANPCGNAGGASATIGVMASNVAVQGRFHALSVNGVASRPGAYPSGSPDVLTPSVIAVGNTSSAVAVTATVYERSYTFSSYYVVLCGNAVFQSGPARYAGPFPYPTNAPQRPVVAPSLPPVIFFRDPGDYASVLTQPLPPPYRRPCPAPPPANTYLFPTLNFYQIGQSVSAFYWANGQSGITVTFASSNASVVTVDPPSIPEYATAPPSWPPPANITTITATGLGGATIQVLPSSNCDCTPPPQFVVAVFPTPTPAPVPTPLPNTITPSPSPTPSASPTPTPSPTPSASPTTSGSASPSPSPTSSPARRAYAPRSYAFLDFAACSLCAPTPRVLRDERRALRRGHSRHARYRGECD